jgi:uncharacterized membrane protein
LTKVALGVFVGSFVYAMVLLPEVRGPAPRTSDEFVPGLAVFVAFLLVLASVGVFVRYLHNMAHAIRAVHIIRRVATETRMAINQLFPSSNGGSRDPEVPDRPSGPPRVFSSADHAGRPQRTCPSSEQDAGIDRADRRNQAQRNDPRRRRCLGRIAGHVAIDAPDL